MCVWLEQFYSTSFFANVVIKMLNTFASQLSLTTRICHLLLYYPWLLFLLPLLCLYTYSCTVCFFFACTVAPHANVGYRKTPDQAIDPPSVRRCARCPTFGTYIHTYVHVNINRFAGTSWPRLSMLSFWSI